MDECCEFLPCLGHIRSSPPLSRQPDANDPALYRKMNVFSQITYFHPEAFFLIQDGCLLPCRRRVVGTVSDLQRQRPSVHTASVVARKLSYSVWLHCEYVFLPESLSLSYVCSLPCSCKFFRTCYCCVWWQIVFSFFGFHVHYCVNVLEPK